MEVRERQILDQSVSSHEGDFEKLVEDGEVPDVAVSNLILLTQPRRVFTSTSKIVVCQTIHIILKSGVVP